MCFPTLLFDGRMKTHRMIPRLQTLACIPHKSSFDVAHTQTCAVSRLSRHHRRLRTPCRSHASAKVPTWHADVRAPRHRTNSCEISSRNLSLDRKSGVYGTSVD